MVRGKRESKKPERRPPDAALQAPRSALCGTAAGNAPASGRRRLGETSMPPCDGPRHGIAVTAPVCGSTSNRAPASFSITMRPRSTVMLRK